MIMNVEYFENKLNITDEKVLALEIENKKYFYRFINDLYKISNGACIEEINLYEKNDEINMTNKIRILINFFDLEFDSKKTSNILINYINEHMGEYERLRLNSEYNKMLRIYKRFLNEIDLPLIIENNINVENFTKNLKINIDEKKDLLDNLLLIIDYEKITGSKKMLICVNLKQYLTKVELVELYKYAIYNQIKIILIDSQCYGTTLNLEKKLIIDETLEEFMI